MYWRTSASYFVSIAACSTTHFLMHNSALYTSAQPHFVPLMYYHSSHIAEHLFSEREIPGSLTKKKKKKKTRRVFDNIYCSFKYLSRVTSASVHKDEKYFVSWAVTKTLLNQFLKL